MKSRHGIACEDKFQVTTHGKGVADGDGSAVKGMVKKSFYDDHGEGSRNIIRHLAAKYPSPNVKCHAWYFGMRGIYATTKYIYMYIPDHAIDEKFVAVDVGYSGLSNGHSYRSLGATAEAARLSRRERACGC